MNDKTLTVEKVDAPLNPQALQREVSAPTPIETEQTDNTQNSSTYQWYVVLI